jgi:hypothetical protein
MDIKRIGSQPSSKGLSDYFTDTVRIDPLFPRFLPRGQWQMFSAKLNPIGHRRTTEVLKAA